MDILHQNKQGLKLQFRLNPAIDVKMKHLNISAVIEVRLHEQKAIQQLNS